MKLNIPAVISLGSTTVSVGVARTANNDAILDRVARRVLDMKQLCLDKELQSVMACDQLVGQLTCRKEGALFDSVFQFTEVSFEVSRRSATISLSASHPEACSLSMVHIPESWLRAMLLEQGAARPPLCVWCQSDQALVVGEDGKQHCPVCEGGLTGQVGADLLRDAGADASI